MRDLDREGRVFNPPGLEACSEFKLPIENRVCESEVTYGYVERTAEDIINYVGVWTESLICSIAKLLPNQKGPLFRRTPPPQLY